MNFSSSSEKAATKKPSSQTSPKSETSSEGLVAAIQSSQAGGRGKEPPSEKSSVSIEDFSFWYGIKQALFDVNLEVLENRVTALIGPSGCGKSTLLRSINRMNDLIPGVNTSGKIYLGDADIYSHDQDVITLRKYCGMVFQKSNPFPKSIFENVVYPCRISGQRDRKELAEIAEQSLKRTALWDEVKDRLHTNGNNLSGGQQQRLCIARAIANKPDVLLMDEPCSALDPVSTSKIEELILELRQDYTVVIVTHNMQQAARVSDYTAFMLMGKLVEYGPTEKIFQTPAEKETEDYITGRFG